MRLATTSSSKVFVDQAIDFTKGLRWGRSGMTSDKFAPDAMNVDWLADGGWTPRKVTTPLHSDTLTNPAVWLGGYEDKAGNSWVVMSFADGSIRAMAGPHPGGATFQIKGPGGGVWRGAEVNWKMIFQDGVNQPQMWDGVTLTAVPTNVYNAPPAGAVYNPTDVGIPTAKYQVTWRGRHWVMNTRETGVDHPNRIRSSYPLFNLKGERDYTQAEYLDLDLGASGEVITGAVECGGRMYVFKNHSVFQVDGANWSSDLFSFNKMGSVGVTNPEAITCVSGEVYFYDASQGFARIIDVPNTAGRFQYIDSRGSAGWFGEPMTKLLEDEMIPPSRVDQITVHQAEGRVLYSVPWKTGGKRTLVFDPAMNTWSMYDLELGAGYLWQPTNGRARSLAVNRAEDAQSRVLMLAQRGERDSYGPITHEVCSYVQTYWMDGQNPAARKNWRCITVLAEGLARLDIKVFGDYDLGRKIGAEVDGLGSRTRLAPAPRMERLSVGGQVTPMAAAGPGTGVASDPNCIKELCANPDAKGCITTSLRAQPTKAIAIKITSNTTNYVVRGILGEFTWSVRS